MRLRQGGTWGGAGEELTARDMWELATAGKSGRRRWDDGRPWRGQGGKVAATARGIVVMTAREVGMVRRLVGVCTLNEKGHVLCCAHDISTIQSPRPNY